MIRLTLVASIAACAIDGVPAVFRQEITIGAGALRVTAEDSDSGSIALAATVRLIRERLEADYEA